MDFEAIKKSIDRGVIAPLYLFSGTEGFLMKKIIESLKEKFLPEGLEAFNYDELDGEKTVAKDIVNIANMVPVFGEKRIVLVKEPAYFQANKSFKGDFSEDELIKYFQNPSQSTCLIFMVTAKLDKRKKIYKEIKKNGEVVDFSNLHRGNLHQWILGFFQRENKRIEKEALEYLIILGNEGLEFLQNELNKVLLYCYDEENISLEMLRDVVSNTSEVNIFNLIDSIANKEGKKAIIQLNTSLSNGEAALKLIYLLVRQFRMMLLAKDFMQQGYPENFIREKLKVPAFVVGKILGQSHRFSFRQLVAALNLLAETETSLKSTASEEKELMEDVVIRLCYS